MDKTELEKDNIKDLRREQIAAAALKVFSLRSFFGATMTDIAKEAGISHGLIYHYFKDKQEIFDFAENQNSSQVYKQIEEIYKKDIDFKQKFTEITQFFLDTKSKDKYFSYRLFASISKRIADMSMNIQKSAGEQNRRKTGKLIFSVFEEGEKLDKLAAGMDAQSASALFWKIITGTGLGNILKPEKQNKDLAKITVKLFIKD